VVIEVDGFLDEAQSERANAEIEIGLRIVHRRGDMMQAEDW
jgi:hypothetical protein